MAKKNEKPKGEQKFAAAEAAAADVILAAMIDGVAIVDSNGNVIQANEAFLKMFGSKSPDEPIGVHFTEFLTERSVANAVGGFKKALEKGIGVNEVYIVKDAGGREFPVLLNSSVLKDEKGELVGVICVMRDITELKRAQEKEKELAIAQERSAVFDDIIELNPYSVQICDAEGHHIRANKGFKKLFGSTPPPEWSIFNDPLLKKAGFSELLEKLKKGETIKIPAIWYNAHDVAPEAPDNPICLGATHFPVFDDKGNLKFIVNMHEDITEFKHLQEKEKELVMSKVAADTIEAMIDAVGIADLNMRINSLNKACFKMFGYEREEIIGKSVAGLFPERERKLLMERSREDIKKGIARVSIYTGVKKDGTEFPVQISVSVRKDKTGKPIEFIAVLRDITELKRAEVESMSKLKELEDFHDVAVGRELKMAKMEEEIERLKKELTSAKVK